MYQLGCKRFLGFTDHATLVHQLKQTSDKLIDRQTHLVEKLMPCANLVRILYTKGILNDADPVSRRPDFLPIDNMYKQDESFWWDEKVAGIDTNGKALHYWHYQHWKL